MLRGVEYSVSPERTVDKVTGAAEVGTTPNSLMLWSLDIILSPNPLANELWDLMLEKDSSPANPVEEVGEFSV